MTHTKKDGLPKAGPASSTARSPKRRRKALLTSSNNMEGLPCTQGSTRPPAAPTHSPPKQALRSPLLHAQNRRHRDRQTSLQQIAPTALSFVFTATAFRPHFSSHFRRSRGVRSGIDGSVGALRVGWKKVETEVILIAHRAWCRPRNTPGLLEQPFSSNLGRYIKLKM